MSSNKTLLQKISSNIVLSLLKLRDILWHYPEYTRRIFKRTKPIPQIILAILLTIPVSQHILTMEKQLYAENKTTFQEGYIGNVSTVNPLIETNNQLEKDLKALIYSPLFRVDPEGKLTYKLAKSYSISEDHKTYTFTLRDDVWWHHTNSNSERQKFTADDVIHTFKRSDILKEQNLSIKKVDDYEVKFNLPQENPIFLETITIGILPKYIWENIPDSEITTFSILDNQLPIGTGPYYVSEFVNDEYIKLKRNETYYDQKPPFQELVFHLLNNEKELIEHIQMKKVDSILKPSSEITELINKDYPEYEKYSKTIYRNTKLMFLNLEKESVLQSAEMRRVISMSINREKLVQDLNLGGKKAISPIPQNSWAFNPNKNYFTYDPKEVKNSLDSQDWSKSKEGTYRTKGDQVLSIEITYLETPNNISLINYIESDLKKLGIKLSRRGIPNSPEGFSTLTQEIIPKRDFEMLLFEIETSLDPDAYSWWHSTQTDFPGLNLSGYQNSQVDFRLERARETLDKDERKDYYDQFIDFFMYDMPAIYLYHPAIEYYVSDRISGIDLSLVTIAEERFDNMASWEVKHK